MRIVLIRPNYESTVISPHIGMGYLSSYLKMRGIETVILDNLLYKYDYKKLLKKIKDIKPDCVGITCLSAFYRETKDLSLELKRNGMKVIIGGVHPTFLPYTTLKETKCDFVICGEGEEALCNLLLNNFDNKTIKGVYKMSDLNSEEHYETTDLIKNLDSIPFPDWSQIDPKKYPLVPMGTVSKKFPIAPIMTSRGCCGACKFCASPFFYKHKVRFRSPENVIEEIKLLVNEYGVKEIQFIDDNPIVNPDYAKKLYNLMLENNLKIPWSCINGIRADSLTEEMAKLMKNAGCYQVVIGIESANNQILNQIGKNETIQQIDEAINTLHSVGITTRGNFIFGLPGENKSTIEETINFALKSKLDRAFFSILDIIPGCALWQNKNYKCNLSYSNTSFVKPNWVPDGLTSKNLEQALARAYRKFYLRPSKFAGILQDLKPSQYRHLLHRMAVFGIINN